MVAEAVLSVFIEKVANLLIEEARSLTGISDQLQWIHREMNQMSPFLRDAEEKKKITSHEDTLVPPSFIRIWLFDIQENAYDVEDLIENYIFHKSQQRRRSFFNRYSLIFHDLLALHKLAKEIKRIQINIRSISDRRLTYRFQNIGGERGVRPLSLADSYLREQRPTSPLSSQIVIPIASLLKDVELLEKRLIDGDDLRNVVSIVGKAGSGKTTLARTIYNSDIVRRHFDCFVWIHVSKDHVPRDLLQEIKEKIRRSSCEETVPAREEDEVQESLFHRKYLIVLDDVWETYVLYRLLERIPDFRNGSKLLLTTCNRDVGIHADKEPHKVRLLNEQDSWMLFRHFAFKGKKDFPPDLNKLGRRIVGYCEGLPLAIEVMGGVLCTKEESVDAWSRLLDSESWNLMGVMGHCLVFSLSYYDLPFYLKPCFLYFGIFPEGFEIPVKRLIRLWIAEGLVYPRGEEELEDVGKDYIKELFDRNIIQLTYSKENVKNFNRSAEMDQKTKMALVTMNGKPEGRRLTCCMHGILRDLSISIGNENNFLEQYYAYESYAKEIHYTSYALAEAPVRRVAVYFDADEVISLYIRKVTSLNRNIKKMTSLTSTQKLHSLSFFDIRKGATQSEENGNFHLQSILDRSRFLFLKVLDLEGTYKPRLPKALGKLIHLRYLGLRRSWLDKLPPSVADLFNLQTLDLKCTELQVIPQGIWRMEHLRHLYLDGGSRSRVTTGTNDYCSLRNLRTLYGIFVGEENCVRRKLNMLTKIRKLGIEGDLISQGEELADWIASLHRLEHLKLKLTAGELILEPSRDWERPYWSLNKLHLEGKITFFPNSPAFLSGLTKLTLIGTLKESDPMRALGLLENLRILRLCYNSYVGRSMICSSGDFPKLEILVVSWLEELEDWVVEEGAMPNLIELEINKCNKLIQLPGGLKFLNNLKELRLPAISNALKSRVLPYTGEDWYKIQHIPLISPLLRNDAAPTTASTSSNSRHPTL